MKKLLFLAAIIPSLAFASNDIDMSNLKCGNMQVYSNTTLQNFRDNCNIKREFEIQHTNYRNLSTNWFGQKTMHQVIFDSPDYKDPIRCDFLSASPEALVVGCRS